MLVTDFNNFKVYVKASDSFIIVTVILTLNKLVNFANFNNLDINNITYYLEYSFTILVSSSTKLQTSLQ